MERLLCLGWVLCLPACGTDGATGADAIVAVDDALVGDAGSDGFVPAPHDRLPQLPDQGGPRLHHPQVVTVTFAGDARNATFEPFAQWIVGSNWLAAVGAEYGVGAGAVAGAVQLKDPAPMTTVSADIETLLAGGVQNGTIPRPAGGLGDALYMIYFPATTSITATFVDGITKQSCVDFGAYHGEVHQGGLDFAYAAMPDCNEGIDGIESAASHEFIEAATDAFPITAPAFQLRVDRNSAWFSAFGFEVEAGDLCEVPAQTVREAGFVAQRSWSNAAAAAGADPCVPADPTVAYYATTAADAVQHVAPGGTVEYTLHAFSSAPTLDWRLSTQVFGPFFTTPPFKPTTTFSSRLVNNGATVTMNVAIPSSAAPGSITIFLVSDHTQQDYHTWPLYLTVP